MQIVIEFTGLARSITKRKEIPLVVQDGITYKEIVRRIGELFPGLVGVLIDTDGETFLSSNMFIINGDMSLPAMIMEESPQNGDRLILMSLVTGG
jgi:hypothetical protein